VPATTIFNDIFFTDEVNGYLVGNNDVVLRTQTTTLAGDDYGTGSWAVMPVSDGLNGQLSPANGTFHINAIAMTSSTNGTLGGWFNNTTTSSIPKVYARKLRDESGLYSTYFYYDRLGRIVASQNTRQFNETPKKYSYTLYDGLGRVFEAGEKAENTTPTQQFNSIFGAVVNYFTNPNVIDDTKLQTWVNDVTGNRSQVTRTQYDVPETTAVAPTFPTGFTQDNLRKRIASVFYYENYSATTPILDYAHATHYSYDIHGNVKTLLQDNRKLATNSTFAGFTQASEQFNRIDYTYDLISGNVHEVNYEKTKHDQWSHKYTYDADNRITDVSTSTDHVIWDKDAKYFYYAHGPLART
ncbi:MAG TPA: hypothetical protein VD905_01720, partial [Flavobacteriales bacterium]|nr:hypothetical protein [Flavobacteriales bacterium]